MNYHPSHGKPPRQERWPQATPPEGWPPYRDGAYQDGDTYRDGEQAGGRYGGERPGAHQATGGYQSQAGYQRGGPGDRDYRPVVVTTARGGYGQTWDGYDRTANSYGQTVNGHHQAANGYDHMVDGFDQTVDGYAPAANGYDPADGDYGWTTNGYRGDGHGYGRNGNGHAGTIDDYPGTADEYPGAIHDYPGAADDFDGAADGYRRPGAGPGYGQAGYTQSDYTQSDYTQSGYGQAADEYPVSPRDYEWSGDGYDFAGPGYLDAEPASADAMLGPPDARVDPDSWQADQDRRREAERRGPAVGAVTGFLAAAVAIGVATLAAAFVRPQASPVTAFGGVFIDRMPSALKTSVAGHFGSHGRAVLLLGMYVLIAVVAIGIGVLTRHAAASGVACVAACGVFGAFITITRPGGQVADVTPSVVGGLAGIAALLWLMRASAPVSPPRRARGGTRRRAR